MAQLRSTIVAHHPKGVKHVIANLDDNSSTVLVTKTTTSQPQNTGKHSSSCDNSMIKETKTILKPRYSVTARHV